MLSDWFARKSSNTTLATIPSGWRNTPKVKLQKISFIVEDAVGKSFDLDVEYNFDSNSGPRGNKQSDSYIFNPVVIDGKNYAVELLTSSTFDSNSKIFVLFCTINGSRMSFIIASENSRYFVFTHSHGEISLLKKPRLPDINSSNTRDSGFVARMPGKVVKVVAQK